MERRQFLLAAPAGVLAACGGAAETGGPAGDRADLAVLHAALELERSAAALYRVGIEAAPRRRRLLERILEHEIAHGHGIRQAIADLRGRAAPAPSHEQLARRFPRLRDERAFLAFARDFERRAVESYAAGLPRLRSGRLRGTLGSILAAEAEHAAAIARELGGDPLERVLAL